jgi:transcriptional regulator with XRE-family HTH domain
MSDRLQTELEIELDHSQLSRIERGESPYNQDNLEAFAVVLRCEPADLIMRDPERMKGPEGIASIWERVPIAERPRAAKVLETFADEASATGTDR